MRPKRSIFAACAAVWFAAFAAAGPPPGEVGVGGAEEPDWAGMRAGRFEPGAEALGDPCGTCPDPAVSIYFGGAFRGAELWMVGKDGTMYRTSGCQVLETISIQGFRGFATDLAWDSRRDVFLVTDPELDELVVVRPNGRVVTSYPSPLTGPIGAAYDSTRDVFWVSDWEEDMIHPVDAVTGAAGAGFAVPEGSRISGLGFDRANDRLFYNARNQRTCYALSASTHEVEASFGLPGNGFENGEGIAVAPDGRLWIHVFENAAFHCFDSDVVTPVRATRWGELKRRYLR